LYGEKHAKWNEKLEESIESKMEEWNKQFSTEHKRMKQKRMKRTMKEQNSQ
jgi:hypothetical protein